MEKRVPKRASFVLAIATASFLVAGLYMNVSTRSAYSDLLHEQLFGAAAREGGWISPSPPTREQLELERLDQLRSRHEYIQAAISAALLLAALYVILSKRYTMADKHWAYTTIGTIVGFWLGGASG